MNKNYTNSRSVTNPFFLDGDHLKLTNHLTLTHIDFKFALRFKDVWIGLIHKFLVCDNLNNL